MAGRVTLVVRPHNAAETETYLEWTVDRDFLNAALGTADADGRVALIITPDMLIRWTRGEGLAWPLIQLLDGRFRISLSDLVNHRADPDNLRESDVDTHFNGVGLIRPITRNAASYEFFLESGQTSIFVQGGFNARPSFLVREGGVPDSPTLSEWQSLLWPEAGTSLERVSFGARMVQIDVIGTASRERRRVELRATHPDYRLWQLCDCQLGFRTAADESRAIQERLTNHFQHGTAPIRLVRRASAASPGEIFYRNARTQPPPPDPLRVFLRPQFQLTFQDGTARTAWTPLIVEVRTTTLVVSDQSLEAALEPAAAMASTVEVAWQRTAGDWRLQRSTIAGNLRCLGSDTVALQNHKLWHYAGVTPVPGRVVLAAAGGALPAWVRYSVAEPLRTPGTSAEGLSLPLATALSPEQWSLRITIPPALSTDKPQWRVTVRESVETLLEGFGVSVRAATPPILAFNGRLASPDDPPNCVRLAATGDHPDPLTGTSLVFETAVETAAADDPTVTLDASLAANRWTIAPRTGAVQVWFGSTRLAVVDLLSPARRNLLQRLDPVTARAVAERDGSHGLTPWSTAASFHLNTSGSLAVLEFATSTLDAQQGQRDGAVALTPWVECRDALSTSVDRRRLHHSNLVLEHEAVAVSDRSDGQTGDLSRTDRVEAVRDAFSLAAAELPETAAAAVPVAHWLPGAALVQSNGATFDEPRVWWEPRTGIAALADRQPVVHRAATAEALSPIISERHTAPAPWLRQDLRWDGWIHDAAGRRPRILVADAAPQPGPQTAFNGAVPLLFDRSINTAAAWDGERVIFGDARGQIRIHDTRTRRRLHTLAMPGSIRAAGVRMATPLQFAAIDAVGHATNWFEDGNLTETAIPLPAMTTDMARLMILDDGRVVIARWNSTQFAVHLWHRGTLIAPAIPALGANPASIRVVEVLAAGGDILLAIALGSMAPKVWRGVDTAGVWNFSSLTFQAGGGSGSNTVTLGLLDSSGTPTPYLAVVPANGQQVDLWTVNAADLDRQSTTIWQESGDNAPRTICSVALADSPTPQQTTTPDEAGRLMLSDSLGTVIAVALPRTDLQIVGPRMRWVPRCQPPLRMTPGRWEDRLQLLVAGLTGVATLHDVDGAYERAMFPDDADGLDAMGTVHAGSSDGSSATTRWRFASRPGSPSVGRNDPTSQHPEAGASFYFDFASDQPLVSGGSVPHQTEIYFECEGLLLEHDVARNVWVPARMPATTQPDPERSEPGYPNYRGCTGHWRFFSNLAGEVQALNGAVRIAGLPLSVESLDEFVFDSDADGVRPDLLRSVTLAAVLPNPMTYAGRAVSQNEPLPHAEAEALGLAAGNLLRVVLVADGGTWRVDRVEAERGFIVWSFPATAAPRSGEFGGWFARLVADLAWDPAHRLVLTPRPDDCRADVLGLTRPLNGPLEPLVGYGLDDGPDETTPRFGFRSEPRVVPRFDEPTLLRNLVADAIAAPADSTFASVAVADNNRVTWVDLATGATRPATALGSTLRRLAATAAPLWSVAHVTDRRLMIDKHPLSIRDTDTTVLAMDDATPAPWLARGNRFGSVSVVDLRTEREVFLLEWGAAPIRALALCDCGASAVLAVAADDRPETLLIEFTAEGLSRRVVVPSTHAETVRLVLLRRVADQVHLAVGGDTTIDWFIRSVDGTGWTAQTPVTIPADQLPATALAFGQAGADASLAVAGGTGQVRAFTLTAAPLEVFNLGTVVCALSFYGDLHAVTAGAIHRWVPSTGTASVVSVAGIASRRAAISLRSGRAVVLTDDTVSLAGFDAVTGAPLTMSAISLDAIVAAGEIPVPFALAQTDAATDLQVIDLRTGTLRDPIPLTAPVDHLITVAAGHQVIVFTAAGHELQAWDLLTALAIGPAFDFAEPVQALAANGGIAAVAGAEKAYRWAPLAASPYPSGTPVTLPGEAVTAMALTADALAIAVAGRIDIWTDLADSPQTISPLSETVTVLRAEGSELLFNAQRRLAVWDVQGEPRFLREFDDRIDDPQRIAFVGGWLASGAGRLRLWQSAGIWEFNSLGECRADLRVSVEGRAADGETLSAIILDNRTLRFRQHRPDGSILPLQAVTQDRGIYGFYGSPADPLTAAGREIYGIDTDLGLLAWTRVRERVATVNAEVHVPRVGTITAHKRLNAEAQIVQLDTATVRGKSATGSSVVAARVRVLGLSSTQPIVLHLGEHVVSHEEPPIRLVAHLDASWRVGSGANAYTAAVQGPVSMLVNWRFDTPGTPEFIFIPGVFQVTAAVRDPATASAPQDVGWPRDDASLDAVDLVSTAPLPDVEPAFVRGPLFDTSLPLIWQRLHSGNLPVDLCMDEDAVGSLGGQSIEVPGLIHRLALGARLRYPQDRIVPFDQDHPAAAPRWTPPRLTADRNLWRLTPVLRDGPRCQLARQSLAIDSIQAVAGGSYRTESLLCLAAPAMPSSRRITGIWTSSQIDPDSSLTTAAPLKGLEVAGLIMLRILVDGEPARFRIVARELPDRTAAQVRLDPPPAVPDLDARRAAIQRSRFRIALPGTGRRLRIAPRGHYRPVPVEAAGLLAFRDRVRPDIPEAAPTPGTGVFFRERTAFLAMPARGACPGDAQFAIGDGGWFQPAAFTLRGTPEKPGAVRHVACQGVLRNAEGLQRAPLVELALREPMQLTPPSGAALAITRCDRSGSLTGRSADRIELAWEETLGRMPLDDALPTATVVPIVPVPPRPASADLVSVELEPSPFLQCFVRLDDELLEINAVESRFPAWESSESARQVRKLSREDLIRTLDTTLAAPPRILLAVDTPLGPLIAAGYGQRIEVLDARDGTLLRAHDASDNRVVAAFSIRANTATLLVSDDGVTTGLFDIPLDDATAPIVPRTHGTAPSDVLALAAATATVTLSAATAFPVAVEAALQQNGADAEVLLWWSRLDQTTAPTEAVLRFRDIIVVRHLAIALHQNELLDAVELNITVGVAAANGQIQTCTHTQRLPRDNTAAIPQPADAVSRFEIPRLSTWTIAVASGRPRLLTGDTDGRLLDQDAITGGEPRTLRHASAISQITTAESPLGPLTVVSDAKITTVWDAARSRPLRHLPAEFSTARTVPFARGSGLSLVAADNSTPPQIRLFDLRTAPVTPPEIFLVSPLASLLDDVVVDCPLDDGTIACLRFAPVLVFNDRTDAALEHVTRFDAIFDDLGPAGATGLNLWKYDPDAVGAATRLDLAWDLATRIRFAWRCELASGAVIEAPLFEPLADKQLILKPFSASAARLGGVVFVDSKGGAPVALFQRLAFFGDAAPTRTAVPSVRTGSGDAALDFAIAIRERETFDQPLPSVAASLSVVLVKYLSQGQVMTAGSITR